MGVLLNPLVLLLLLGILAGLVLLLMRGQQTETQRHRIARIRVERATDLAWHHDEISPALAGAIIDRTKGLGPDTSVHELERAADDVLELARRHRPDEPDLATIVIDTVRSRELG